MAGNIPGKAAAVAAVVDIEDREGANEDGDEAEFDSVLAASMAGNIPGKDAAAAAVVDLEGREGPDDGGDEAESDSVLMSRTPESPSEESFGLVGGDDLMT